MTTRELVNSPAVKLLAWGAAFGIAWATLQAQVSGKADVTDVQRIEALLIEARNETRNNTYLLCRDPRNIFDSVCKEFGR